MLGLLRAPYLDSQVSMLDFLLTSVLCVRGTMRDLQLEFFLGFWLCGPFGLPEVDPYLRFARDDLFRIWMDRFS